MRLSKYEKSFDLKKRQFSRSDHRNVELPSINKTIDVNTKAQNSALQAKVNFLNRFSWALIQQDYDQLTDNEIYKEYTTLRKQIFNINDLVVKQLEKMQKRAERKRLVTTIEPDKVNEIRQKQIQNNVCILQRMRKQFKGLVNKSETLQPKDLLEEQIQNVKSQMVEMKLKISSLKLKNKTIGDNIVNTDQVLVELKNLQRESEVWIKKRNILQSKLQKVKVQKGDISLNLDRINNTSDKADSYIKSEGQSKKDLEKSKMNQEKYEEKTHSFQVLRKNFQIFSALRQQKYHQLLKQLQGHLQKDQTIQTKTIQVQYQMIQFSEQISLLQSKLKTLKDCKQKMNTFQTPFTQDLNLSINSKQQNFYLKRNKNLKFNTFSKTKTSNRQSYFQSSRKQPGKKVNMTEFQMNESPSISQKTQQVGNFREKSQHANEYDKNRSISRTPVQNNNQYKATQDLKKSTHTKQTAKIIAAKVAKGNTTKIQTQTVINKSLDNLGYQKPKVQRYDKQKTNSVQIPKQQSYLGDQIEKSKDQSKPVKSSQKQIGEEENLAQDNDQIINIATKQKKPFHQLQKSKTATINQQNTIQNSNFEDQKDQKKQKMVKNDQKIDKQTFSKDQQKFSKAKQTYSQGKQTFSMQKFTIDLQKIERNLQNVQNNKKKLKKQIKLKTLSEQDQQIDFQEQQNI